MNFRILKDVGDVKGAERYFVFQIFPDECLLAGYIGMWRKKPTKKEMVEKAKKHNQVNVIKRGD